MLLANHGVVACGATLAGAVTLAFEVENLAGQYLDLLAAGLKPVLLNKARTRRSRRAIRSLRPLTSARPARSQLPSATRM